MASFFAGSTDAVYPNGPVPCAKNQVTLTVKMIAALRGALRESFARLSTDQSIPVFLDEKGATEKNDKANPLRCV